MNLTPDSRLFAGFVVGAMMIVALSKARVWSVHREEWRALTRGQRALFWLGPLPEFMSIRRAQRVSLRLALGLAVKLLAWSVLWALAYGGLRSLVICGSASGLAVAYLAAPVVYLTGEVAGGILQLTFAGTGYLLPPHHQGVLTAPTLAEFWGRRWNSWVSDWLRGRCFFPLRKRPLMAVAIVFLVSGFVHELLINLPFWLRYERSLFGGMMAYFGLQAVGLIGDRWIGRRDRPGRSLVRRLWLWSVVVLPCPLIINESALRMMGLWRGMT